MSSGLQSVSNILRLNTRVVMVLMSARPLMMALMRIDVRQAAHDGFDENMIYAICLVSNSSLLVGGTTWKSHLDNAILEYLQSVPLCSRLLHCLSAVNPYLPARNPHCILMPLDNAVAHWSFSL